jgi:hypothetical protein
MSLTANIKSLMTTSAIDSTYGLTDLLRRGSMSTSGTNKVELINGNGIIITLTTTYEQTLTGLSVNNNNKVFLISKT